MKNRLLPFRQALLLIFFILSLSGLTYGQVNVSGLVLGDANGLTDNTVNGPGVDGPALPVYASLVQGGTVVTTVPVTATGTYSFSSVAPDSYSVVLSTSPSGSVVPSVPTNFTNTGENIGTGTGSDGSPDGILTVTVGTSNVTEVNFGIEQAPTVVAAFDTPVTNPGGTATSPVSATVFRGSDPEDGTYPNNLTGRTVTLIPGGNGTLFYNGSPVTSTLVITNFDPTKVSVDPSAPGATDGDPSEDVFFTYSVTDNAGVPSPPQLVRVPFTERVVSISGNVFNDANGLSDNTVSGTGVNGSALALYVSLVFDGRLFDTVPVTATGTYSLTGVTSGFSYSIVLSTSPSGSVVPSVPTNFTNTGENIGTTAGSDGISNGVISVSVASTNVVDVNFGVEVRPVVNNADDVVRPNPGGTVTSPVSQTAFSGTDFEDGTYPNNLTGRTVTLFTGLGGNIYYNGVVVSSSLVITNFNPTLVSVDPTSTDATTVTFVYSVRDNANVDSDFKVITVPFTVAMPVSLVSFTAQVQSDRTVLLNWKTSWERNNKGYVIERSKDLQTFEVVGQVSDVAGNSSSVNTYQFVDQRPYRGTSYYRLVQVDVDGSSRTYKAESVVIEGRYGVYPNPIVGHSFMLNLDEPARAVVHLYDATGREVKVGQKAVSELSMEVSTVSKLPTGVYVLTVEERGSLRKYRLIVQ